MKTRNKAGNQEMGEMKISGKRIPGFDSYASILTSEFCLLTSEFMSPILTSEF